MKRIRKLIAILLTIAVALTVTAAFVFVAHEADHECCGHDCPVCAAISVIGRILVSIVLVSAALTAAGTVRAAAASYVSGFSRLRVETPVSMKTRLLN